MKIHQFKPAEGYCIVEPLDKTSKEGMQVYLDEFPQLAKIISIGSDTYNSYTDRTMNAPCKVDDIIIHSAGGFETLKFEGKEYRVIHFTKILAIKK